MTENGSFSREVLVCQNRTCRKQGGVKVLAAFQALPVPDVTVTASSCLGQCGNGPMVLVMPEQVWYNRVHPDEVPAVVERHLIGGIPVGAMVYEAVSTQHRLRHGGSPTAISLRPKPR